MIESTKNTIISQYNNNKSYVCRSIVEHFDMNRKD